MIFFGEVCNRANVEDDQDPLDQAVRMCVFLGITLFNSNS